MLAQNQLTGPVFLTFISILPAKYLNIERLANAVRWTNCAVQPVKTTIQHKLLNLNSSNSYHLHAKLGRKTFELLPQWPAWGRGCEGQ